MSGNGSSGKVSPTLSQSSALSRSGISPILEASLFGASPSNNATNPQFILNQEQQQAQAEARNRQLALIRRSFASNGGPLPTGGSNLLG